MYFVFLIAIVILFLYSAKSAIPYQKSQLSLIAVGKTRMYPCNELYCDLPLMF